MNPLIDIAMCGIHIVNGAFKTGAESTSWDLKGVLKGSYQLLHDTPARRDDYTSINGSGTYPLSFCATRWIKDKTVADCLEIWEKCGLRHKTQGKLWEEKSIISGENSN